MQKEWFRFKKNESHEINNHGRKKNMICRYPCPQMLSLPEWGPEFKKIHHDNSKSNTSFYFGSNLIYRTVVRINSILIKKGHSHTSNPIMMPYIIKPNLKNPNELAFRSLMNQLVLLTNHRIFIRGRIPNIINLETFACRGSADCVLVVVHICLLKQPLMLKT